jgi:hypothetical protein
MSSSGL